MRAGDFLREFLQVPDEICVDLNFVMLSTSTQVLFAEIS